MCKWSDPFSKRVLIGRGLDHNSLETLKSQRKNVSSDYSVLKARPSKKHWTKYNMYVILGQSDRSVSMTVRFHLFPFRTQKLSSLVPKIVRWKRRVKIGSRRLEQKRFRRNSEAFFFTKHSEQGEEPFMAPPPVFSESRTKDENQCLLASLPPRMKERIAAITKVAAMQTTIISRLKAPPFA